MLDISPVQILIVLVIALLVFGPKRLPEMGKSIGRGIREFKGAILDDEPAARPPRRPPPARPSAARRRPGARAPGPVAPAPARTTTCSRASCSPGDTPPAGPATPSPVRGGALP